MTREDIIRMAEEAQIEAVHTGRQGVDAIDVLMSFANIVAAAERDRCCAIVFGQCESDNVAQRTADAIRARGEA